MARIVVAGYYGCGNLGDDALLLGLLHGLSPQGHSFTVMSGAPEETFRLHGLTAVPRRDMGAVRTSIQNSDALLFAGGSIFQDATSVRSVWYYANLVKMAKQSGKKVLLVGQGVGPLRRWLGKRWAVQAFQTADVIVVRDNQSAQTLKELGVTRPVRVAADPAFLLPEPQNTDPSSFNVGNMKAVGLAPRPFGDKNEMADLFAALARGLFQNNAMPVLIQMDRNHDGPLLDSIGKSQGGKIPDLRKLQTPIQVQQRMARMDAVIAVRLHAGILATTVGVPTLMLDYDPKVAAFAAATGIPVLPAKGSPASRVLDRFDAMLKDRDEAVQKALSARDRMKELAAINVEAVAQALGQG